MARGSASKETITSAILAAFPGSFLYNGNKEIRIPVIEDGEVVQIKVTLTAAKVNVGINTDTILPGEKADTESPAALIGTDFKMTDEELAKVKEILAKLQ